MDFNEYGTIGLLFLDSLVFVYDRNAKKFVIAGVELLDCRVVGNYDTLIETSEQEWPFDDEDYS